MILLLAAYVGFKYGIAYLPPLVGVKSALVPQSVLIQYMLIAAVGIFIYVSSDAGRWERFQQPIGAALRDPDKRWVRGTLIAVIPLAVGYATYQQTKPRVSAPIQLRSIHPQSGGGGHNFGFAVRKNSPNLARPNGLIYVFSAGLLAGRKLSAWSHVLAA